jgi:hypothetical protein
VKRSTRLIIVIFLIGLSLLIATLMRTNSTPTVLSFGNEEEGATSGWVMYPDFLMFPRDYRVDIRANNTVDVYVLDQAAAEQWNASGTLNAMRSYKAIEQGVFNEHVDIRGGYAILVYMPTDSVTAIKVTLTFSGIEKDLVAFSLIIMAAGLVVLNILEARKNKKPPNPK